VFLIVLILILIVLIVLSVHTVLYISCTRIPVSASEPRCSIISVHFICLLVDFRIYTYHTLILKFSSIKMCCFKNEKNSERANPTSYQCFILPVSLFFVSR